MKNRKKGFYVLAVLIAGLLGAGLLVTGCSKSSEPETTIHQTLPILDMDEIAVDLSTETEPAPETEEEYWEEEYYEEEYWDEWSEEEEWNEYEEEWNEEGEETSETETETVTETTL